VDKSKLRLAKPANGTPPTKYSSDNEPKTEINIRKLNLSVAMHHLVVRICLIINWLPEML
jgi:hypothetical protein